MVDDNKVHDHQPYFTREKMQDMLDMMDDLKRETNNLNAGTDFCSDAITKLGKKNMCRKEALKYLTRELEKVELGLDIGETPGVPAIDVITRLEGKL